MTKYKKEAVLLFLNMKLTNEKLYNKIISTINNYKKTNYTTNIISGKNKKTKESFKLNIDIENGEIYFENTLYDGSSIEKIYIKFEGEKIVVQTNNFNKVVLGDSNDLSELEKKSKTQIYINNKLRYEKTCENSFSLYKNHSGSQFSEIFIGEDNNAIKKSISAGDKEYFHGNEIIYMKSDNYNEPPFNTRVNNKGVYISTMINISKEEYDEIKKQLQNNKKLILK